MPAYSALFDPTKKAPVALPGFPLTSVPGMATSQPGYMSDDLEKVLPGFNQLGHTATGNIQQLLSGNISPDVTRSANAYFGAQSGMPQSDFVRNRGFDLYRQEGNAAKETGLKDMLALLSGYSGAVIPTAGQDIQQDQFGRNLAQNESQFGRNLSLDQQKIAQQNAQFLAELGLGRERLGETRREFDLGLRRYPSYAEYKAQLAREPNRKFYPTDTLGNLIH